MSTHLRKLLAALCALLLSAAMATGKSAGRTTSRPKNGKTLSTGKLASAKTASKSRRARRATKSSKRRYAKRRRSWRHSGQQAIKPDRAREIQEALVRENYLDVKPTGVWDARSKEAMARYQRDNGWQAKVTPDSRALIKLGLGPNHDNLLNPETAATTLPPPPSGTQQPVPVDYSAGRP
ncbi:MAG TPA: peptidoglycan-binding domain-containing protein [Terriglobales bacterium]|nr:peptidoglycan-binding domain-containing protein [Terriglobales bacterium]